MTVNCPLKIFKLTFGSLNAVLSSTITVCSLLTHIFLSISESIKGIFLSIDELLSEKDFFIAGISKILFNLLDKSLSEIK